MEFRQLKASIQNNANNNNPDIYMVLCMVDSLLRDIRDESGEFIYNCPVGNNENLPTKLVWLCRIINKIYANKSDELERNRPRLDEMMGELAETEKALEPLAAIPGEIAKLQEKLAGLREEREKRLADKERWEQLKAECNKKEREIAELLQFDPEKAQEDLDKLTAEYKKLSQTKTTLTQECRAQEEKNKPLRAKVAELETDRQRLEQEKTDRTTGVTALEKDLGGLKAEISRLETRVPQLQNEIAQAKSEKSSRQQTVDEAAAKLGGLKKDKQDLETERDNLNSQITACNAEIADLNAQMETLQIQLQEKEQEKQSQTDSVTNLNDNIAGTQADIADLEQQMATLQKTHDELVVNCEWKKKQITSQRAGTEAYRASEFAPVEQRLHNAEEEYQKLLEQKAEKEQTLDGLNKERTNTVTEIALIEGEIEKATAVRNTKKAELEDQKATKEALETEQKQLSEQLQAVRSELETVQTSVHNLKTNDIPEAEVALQTEQDRELEQEKTFASLTREKADLEQKNQQTAIKLAELKTEVKKKDAAYQVLSAKWDANNAELEELKAKLKELEETADSEMLEMRKRRLNADISRLEAIKKETEEKESTLEKQRQALSAAQAEKERLENDLKDLTRQTREIKAVIGELTPLTAPEIKEKLTVARGQLSTLKEARGQLSAAVKTMEGALGSDRNIADEIGLNRLNKDLDALYSFVTDVQNALEECANSLKLEVH